MLLKQNPKWFLSLEKPLPLTALSNYHNTHFQRHICFPEKLSETGGKLLSHPSTTTGSQKAISKRKSQCFTAKMPRRYKGDSTGLGQSFKCDLVNETDSGLITLHL